MTQTDASFNPFNVTGAETLAEFPKDHNLPPEPSHIAIFQQIDDLYEEAKNLADGEPIDSDALADMITTIHDNIHALGKRADELRIAEKKPLDDKIAAIQSLYNPYIQAKKGRVDLAKGALGTLLASWRSKVAAEKKAEADRIAAEAEKVRAAANAAMRSSSGNLAEREAAETLLADAKKLEKTAARTFKAATTGTGLRTVWVAELVDEEAAMDWCWGRAKAELVAIAQRNADEAVRGGVRQVPGFVVREEKTASVGRV